MVISTNKVLHMVSTSWGILCVANIVSFPSPTNYLHDATRCVECMGRYLMSIVEVKESERCIMRAHQCYVQWGAMEKAKKILKDWNLDVSSESVKPCTAKHVRDE